MLGLNPLNKTWIVGLGDDPVFSPAHVTGWHTYQGIMPAGIQVEGPYHELANNWLSNTYPAGESRPNLYKYIDIGYVFPMNEPVMRNMSKTAMMIPAIKVMDSPPAPITPPVSSSEASFTHSPVT